MDREQKVIWASSIPVLGVFIVWIVLSMLFVWNLQESLMLKIVLTELVSMALTTPYILVSELILRHYEDTFYGKVMIEANKSAGLWLFD